MEMDFMAPQALFRNKIVFCLILVLICIGMALGQRRNLVIVTQNDTGLAQKQGVLYYHNQPITGSVLRIFPNGALERETTYLDGKQDGTMKGWYANGKPEQDRLFVDGNKQGIHRGWWKNGRLKFEYFFKNDEHNGTAKEWFSDGKSFRVSRYNMGHEEGLQQVWWADGTVRANYVVKDGQQYGLIGRKFCRNIYNK